jgi:hypothetical protein
MMILPRSGDQEAFMIRTAQCCCGSLTVETRTEPARVMVCHCVECQRRTGSAFGAAGYFKVEDVTISGPSTTYVRRGETGDPLRFHFCPTCGSTVYWFSDFRVGIIGVGMGAFADPSFPAPTGSVWERTRHSWVGFENVLDHFPEAMPR